MCPHEVKYNHIAEGPTIKHTVLEVVLFGNNHKELFKHNNCDPVCEKGSYSLSNYPCLANHNS